MATNPPCPRAGLALGSNLGNRLRNLQEARDLLRALAAPGGAFLQAPIYQAAPVDCPDGSPDFYNTVVEIACPLDAHELLERTRAIEFHLGRRPAPERNAPRLIDIDILYYGEQTLDDDLLLLPHPRLTQRRFVLEPLASIRPDLVLPGDEATIAEHLRHLDADEAPLRLVQSSW